MGMPYFIYSSAKGHLVCFYILAIKNNTVMNIHIQGFTGKYVLISLEYIPRREIAGSYDVIG